MEDFERLYALYAQRIYHYLLFRCGDDHIAEELLQETFFQAFRSIHRFRGNAKVSTWLYQIAKNVHLKDQRKRIRTRKFVQTDAALAPPPTPDTVLEQKEQKTVLFAAIRRLKQPFQEVIVLRFLYELSFREIGDVHGQSENWARVTCYRARLQMRGFLEETNGDQTN